MGNTQLEQEAVDEQKIDSSYTVIKYPGAQLPQEYHNMILSKWLRTLRSGNDYFKLIDSVLYHSIYKDYILSVMSRPATLINLAVLTDDHDVVLGWSIVQATTLHYIYTHVDVRRQGIARALTPKHTDTISHVTKSGISFWAAVIPNAKFNPFV